MSVIIVTITIIIIIIVTIIFALQLSSSSAFRLPRGPRHSRVSLRFKLTLSGCCSMGVVAVALRRHPKGVAAEVPTAVVGSQTNQNQNPLRGCPGSGRMLPGSGSQWERGLRYVGGGVAERITTEEARRAVPKERTQRDQRGRSGVPAYRMTRGGVGPGCAYIHIDQSIKVSTLDFNSRFRLLGRARSGSR